ncbi:MAG: OmpA family protein [Nitrospirae bacterium]|nr:OmpA family protein [Nitrospirota bacterium]
MTTPIRHRVFRTWRAALAVLPLCALPWLALAAPAGAEPGSYLMVAPGAVYPDSDRQTTDGWQVGAAAGMNLGDRWALEADGFFGRLGDPGGEHYQIGAGAALLRFFNQTPAFSPFARAGTGMAWMNRAGAGGPKVYGELGAGFVRWLPASPLTMRVDVAYRQTREPEAFGTAPPYADWRLGVGLVLPFGGPKKAPAPPPPAPPPPGDTDGDGVTDDLDRCPDTPPGAVVNPAGCPADTDQDGVIDLMDLCPGTLPRATVDHRGCEPDTDQDGVVNRQDLCPGTRLATRVDARGCPEVKVIRLEGVHFHFDSARLTDPARTVLNGVAATLKSQRALQVEVAGHTDSRGSEHYNLRLSQHRAEAVRQHLVQAGVPAAMLTARGYGEGAPVTENVTDDGRARNRRVELRITTVEGSAPDR